jgi:hypothetical protein
MSCHGGSFRSGGPITSSSRLQRSFGLQTRTSGGMPVHILGRRRSCSGSPVCSLPRCRRAAKLVAKRNRLRLIEDKLAVQGELPSVTTTDEQKPTSLPALVPEDEAQVAALIKALDKAPKLKAKLANASPAVLNRVIATIRSEQARR